MKRFRKVDREEAITKVEVVEAKARMRKRMREVERHFTYATDEGSDANDQDDADDLYHDAEGLPLPRYYRDRRRRYLH